MIRKAGYQNASAVRRVDRCGPSWGHSSASPALASSDGRQYFMTQGVSHELLMKLVWGALATISLTELEALVEQRKLSDSL
jgi:hypothetical protein